jgi:hypothetical protein
VSLCRLLRLGAILAAIAPALAFAGTADDGRPDVLRCRAVSNVGCSEEGICIADSVRDRHPVTFDLKGGRYRSSWGNGRITAIEPLPDGRRSAILASPPAQGEFVFSKDWRSGSAGGSLGYACEILEG